MKHSGQQDSSLKFLVAIVAVLSLSGCRGGEDKVTTLQKDNAKLQSVNADLNSRISALERENNMFRTEYLVQSNWTGSLQNKTGELSDVAALLKSESDSLKSENSDLNGKVQIMENLTRYDGVWQCDKGPDTDSLLSYRLLSSDSCALLTFNKSTNAFVAGKLGSYVVKDKVYQESIEVPAPADKDKDSYTEFTIDKDGNGMSNGTEHWKRVFLYE